MSLHILHYADLENVYDSPERLAKLTELLDSKRTGETLVIGAGDNVAPGVLPLATEGQIAIDFFEQIRPDADTLGNHEFDFGIDTTLNLVKEAPQPYLCGNIWQNDVRFGAEVGVKPWMIIEKGEIEIGLFGVISEETKDSAPETEPLTFSDALAAAEEAVQNLRGRGVDYIVAISHCGNDELLARNLDIPVILGGHRHDQHKAMVEGTLVIRPGVGGHRITEVEIEPGTLSGGFLNVHEAEPDRSLLADVEHKISVLGMDRVVTVLPEPVEKQAMYGETAIGDFVADAFRTKADSDLAIINGGTIRDDGEPLQGAVTEFDIRAISPFDNMVCAVELTGRQVRESLAQMSGKHLEWQSDERWHGQISNATIVYDHQSCELKEAKIDGQQIDPNQTYTVATHETDIRPGGQFPSLNVGEYSRVCHVHDALLDQATVCGIPTRPGNRIRRIGLD